MKNLTIFAALLLSGFVLLPGCACPRRAAESTHTVKRFTGREDGLVSVEEWRDYEGGGGFFFGTDPGCASMLATHTNQTALGGGSFFTAGGLTITVSTNDAAIAGAVGTAAGNIVGAAVKTAVK